MSDSTVIVGMSYRSAPQSVDWLCRVFGFEKRAVHPGSNNAIMHAELMLGGGMLMIGSQKDDEYPRLSKHPDEIGGAETRGANLVVDDADGTGARTTRCTPQVYARAKAVGAEMPSDIQAKPYGGLAFTCRDLEWRIWNVGTYNSSQVKSGEAG